MKKTNEQKEFEAWYGNNMPPSKLPNLPNKPWTKRHPDGAYWWNEVAHGFKCYMAGRTHEIQH